MINGVKPGAYRWSRATYVATASIIAELYRDTDCPTIYDAIAKFATAFETDNPRFNGERFDKAAIVYETDKELHNA